MQQNIIFDQLQQRPQFHGIEIGLNTTPNNGFRGIVKGKPSRFCPQSGLVDGLLGLKTIKQSLHNRDTNFTFGEGQFMCVLIAWYRSGTDIVGDFWSITGTDINGRQIGTKRQSFQPF